MNKKGNKVDGWLIIDKPAGMGSTQVVNLTRRLLNAQKNGHAGTLDPFATGILPIAFGEATKLLDFVIDGDKEYEFTVKWGMETDSADCEGTVISECDKIPSDEEISKIIPQFIDKIKQIPPIYSAIKIEGKRAYDLARQGKEVDMPEREVEIYDLQYLGENKFKVNCSKGTYVRSLGRDMARALGTCGHLIALRRTKCGHFDESHKISLELLKDMVYKQKTVHEMDGFLPITTLLRDIAVMAVDEEEATKLKHGQGLSPRRFEGKFPIDTLAAATFENNLVAIVRIEETRISPIRVFNL